MARKLVGWFKVYSDILEDPRLMTEDWKLAAFVRLLAMVNRSESRDGILRLPYRALGVAMGRSRGDVALKRLRLLVEDGLSCAALYADYVLIIIPNYLETYGNAVPEKCTTKTKTKTKNSTPPLKPPPPASPSAKSGKKRKTSAPAKLSEEDRTKTQIWALDKERWAVQRLVEFEEACLDHHAAKGTTSTDWSRNLKQWIRNHREWNGTGTNGDSNGQGDLLDARRNPITAAVRNIRAEAERAERDHRETDAALPAEAGRGSQPPGLHRGDF